MGLATAKDPYQTQFHKRAYIPSVFFSHVMHVLRIYNGLKHNFEGLQVSAYFPSALNTFTARIFTFELEFVNIEIGICMKWIAWIKRKPYQSHYINGTHVSYSHLTFLNF